jgi:dynein heavy chain 1
VRRELAEAEPALAAAKEAVAGIKKSNLDELRAMRNPPKLVQLTLEAVLVLLGQRVGEWADIQKSVRNENFIKDVLDFDSTKVGLKQLEDVQRRYMSDDSVGVEQVFHASKACGPLFQWAESQLAYCAVVQRISPLRDEVRSLEQASVGLRERKSEADAKVGALGDAIEK